MSLLWLSIFLAELVSFDWPRWAGVFYVYSTLART